jgi:hypothetical protein
VWGTILVSTLDAHYAIARGAVHDTTGGFLSNLIFLLKRPNLMTGTNVWKVVWYGDKSSLPPTCAVMPAKVRVDLLASAACKDAARTVQSLDPSHLPKLPAQGLIVPQGGGLLLLGLDGHVYGRLAGFLTYPNDPASSSQLFVHDVGIQALQSADPTVATVFDRQGRGWLLDAGLRRLVPLDPIEVALAGGAKLVIKASGNGNGVSTTAIVERAGKTLLSGDVTVIGARYASTANYNSQRPGVLLDLVTGKRWKLLPECAVAGVVSGRALAVCQPLGPNNNGSAPNRLYAFSQDGKSRTLFTFAPGLFAESLSLSPDRRWLLVNTSPGCGPGWSAVFPASGGAGRFVTNDGLVPTSGNLPTSRYSYGLGWTNDDRVAADINAPRGSSCEKELSSGTFVIDPRTLSRIHLSSSRAELMWNA